MPRHKTKHKHLPPRMRLVGGRYYWIGHRGGRRPCQPLGADYALALMKWREIEGIAQSGSSLASTLDHYLAVVPTGNPGTLRGYVRAVGRLKAAFPGFNTADVRPHHVARYLSAHANRWAANREVEVLSAAFNRARADGLFDGPNPCAGIRRHQERGRARVATPAEQAAITAGGALMAVACELALLTGLRQGDIRLMRLDQLTDDGLLAAPQKVRDSTGARILFQWTPALRACIARAKLLRRRVGSVYLFPSRTGQPCTDNGFRTLWRKHRESCGITGLQFKDLRRTALNEVEKQRGRDQAREFAGHSSVTTTEGYLRPVAVSRVLPTR